MSPEPAPLARRLRGLTARRTGLAVCLWGEAGVGKTHSVQELLRAAPCRSLSLHAGTPLSGLAGALPQPARWPEWTRRAAGQLRRGQEMSPEMTAAALSAQLSALAPFILHLEDLHEADDGRLALVAGLAQTARQGRGLGLLLTSRLPPPAPLEAEQVGRLTPAQATALLQGRAGGPLPPEAAAWIFGRAAGNPLFTLEYFRFLARQGALWNDGQAWRWRPPEGAGAASLPTTVEALIDLAVRAALQRPELQPVLIARALLWPESSSAVWARVAGCDETDLQRGRAELTRLGLLARGEFVHPLYREVLLRQLPPVTLQAAARQALDALAQEPLRVAELVGCAGMPPAEALGWLTRAADTAQAQGHPTLAARLRARACPLAPPAQAARLALAAAEGLRDSDLAEALRLAEQAAGAGPDQHDELEAATWLRAELLAVQCRVNEAEEVLGRLPAHLLAGRAGQLRLLILRGSGQDHAGVLALLERPELRAALTPAAARPAAWALAQSGRAEEAQALLDEVGERLQHTPGEAEPGGRLQLLKAASLLAYARADFAQMEALEREVLALAQEGGNLRLMDAALYNRALALDYLERYGERLRCLEAALQVCLELGDQTAYVIAQIAYATTLCEFGDYPRAEGLLLEARTILEHTDPNLYQVDGECELSNLYLSWRPPHGAVLARRHAQAALDVARRLGNDRAVVQALHYAVSAELWAGQPAQALALAAEGLRLAAGVDLPLTWMLARIAHGRALEAAGELAEAQAQLAGGEGLALEIGAAITARLVGLERARLDRNLPGARQHLAWFEERGLLNGVHAAARLFPELSPSPASGAAASPSPGARPRLEALGDLCLDGAPVRGRQRRALLGALLEARLRGRGELPRLELLGCLYPQTDEPQALSALKELVHQTRAALGAGLIQTTPGGYALGEVASDAEAFLQTGDTRLWRGLYLAGADLDSDGLVGDTLYRALLGRAQAALAGDPAEAARVGRLLWGADPYDPAALRLTLQALRATGNHRSLGRLYASARAQWLEVGEALPADWNAFLAAEGSETTRA